MRISGLLALASLIVLPASAAVAQSYNYLNQNFAYYHAYRAEAALGNNGVYGNGRCGGISYGTGARSCGTATGGPVGGLSGRN